MNIQYIQINPNARHRPPPPPPPRQLPTVPCHHSKSTGVDYCTCTDHCIGCEELIENDIGKFITRR